MVKFVNTNPVVLVVGTTTDYIDWIRQENPTRALFLTDPLLRREATEPEPHPAEELLCDLRDFEQIDKELSDHLSRWGLTLDGIVCFDCESMELTAFLAEKLSLPYPARESIRLCRDKYAAKVLWRKNGIACPRVQLVHTADGIFDFLQEIEAPCVLKPVAGSGSELVFYCSSRRDCDKGARLIQRGLRDRKWHRLYTNTTTWFLAEEYISGEEYSCDFIISNNRVQIIRLTRKLKDAKSPFGTISGYKLSDCAAEGLNKKNLEDILCRGAQALGMVEALCMVDFLVRDGEIVLLEMTPRPGGDCIPSLLKKAGPFDILTFALDFAQRRRIDLPKWCNGRYVALRLHAKKSGTINRIDGQLLLEDPRVLEVQTACVAGQHIEMPPQDYESWYLGHIIFNPTPEASLTDQCQELRKLFVVDMDYDN